MYIVYIYNKNKQLLTQWFWATKVNIKMKINDISTCSFSVANQDHRSENIIKYDFLKEGNIFDMYKMQNWKEKRIFYGVFTGAKVGIGYCDVFCADFCYLLNKKEMFVDQKYTEKNISEILVEIQNHINNRDANFIKNIETDVTETTNISFKKGKSIFSILKTIAGTTYEFDFVDNILYFKKSLGKNKSKGKDIVLFEYNIFSPESNSIGDVIVQYDMKDLFNRLKVNNDDVKDMQSIQQYGVLEKYFSKWEAQTLLAEKKDSMKEFKIVMNKNDFFLCDVGDIVQVFINGGNEILQFSWPLKVVEKTLQSWDLEKIIIKVNNGKKRSKDLVETLSDIKKDVEELKD